MLVGLYAGTARTPRSVARTGSSPPPAASCPAACTARTPSAAIGVARSTHRISTPDTTATSGICALDNHSLSVHTPPIALCQSTTGCAGEQSASAIRVPDRTSSAPRLTWTHTMPLPALPCNMCMWWWWLVSATRAPTVRWASGTPPPPCATAGPSHGTAGAPAQVSVYVIAMAPQVGIRTNRILTSVIDHSIE